MKFKVGDILKLRENPNKFYFGISKMIWNKLEELGGRFEVTKYSTYYKAMDGISFGKDTRRLPNSALRVNSFTWPAKYFEKVKQHNFKTGDRVKLRKEAFPGSLNQKQIGVVANVIAPDIVVVKWPHCTNNYRANWLTKVVERTETMSLKLNDAVRLNASPLRNKRKKVRKSRHYGEVGKVVGYGNWRNGKSYVKVRWPNGRTPKYAARLLRKEGKVKSCMVHGLIKGRPADKAGIVPGTTILTVAGVSIKSSGGLAKVLRNYKPGTRLYLVCRAPNGNKVTKSVTLYKNNKGKTSIGVICKLSKAEAYKNKPTKKKGIKAKVVSAFSRKKKSAPEVKAELEIKVEEKSPAKTKGKKAKTVAEFRKENALEIEAATEMELVHAYLADMKAADKLLAAKRLKAKLANENLHEIEKLGKGVNAYLTGVNKKSKAVLDEALSPKKGKRRLSTAGKVMLALFVAAGATSYYLGLVDMVLATF